MKLPRNFVCSVLPAGVLLLQTACGGDAAGPGRVATSIAANSSTTLQAPPGTEVLEPPSVLLLDQAGAPVAGASVTFTVTAGGGLVTGGNATTNPSGIATVGSWKLGTAAGANTLSAKTGSLPAVTFTANGFDPCASTASHTLGTTVTGQLAATDCKLQDSSFVDFYSITIPAGGTYIFKDSSATFDTFLALLTSAGALVGTNDDLGPTSTDSKLKVIIPAATYIIGANSFLPNKFGDYSMSSAATTEEVTNCEDVFVLPSIISSQSLQTTDCNTNGFFSDEYVIFMLAGQHITVSMSSSAVDSYLEIRLDGSPTAIVSNDNIDGTTQNAQVSFTAPPTQAHAFYIITAASKVAGATGAYTLTIQP